MRILDDKPDLWPYLLVSLALHALLIAFVPRSVGAPKFEEKPIEAFAVEYLPKEGEPHRIADIAEPAVQQKPKSARFLGLYDSTVSEEMVGNTKPGKAGEEGRKIRKAIGAPSKKAAEVGSKRENRLASRDKLFAFDRNLFEDKHSAIDEEQAGLKTSPGEGGSLDDFYPDFKRGARTYLNVLRYPGVEYFVRMKRAFKIAFNPEPSLRDYFFRNQIVRGSIDVVLGVSVNRSGELAELFVFRGSGIPTYDDEVLRTVRVSAPFATPPEKFLADDGLLRMTWTFSVYL